MKYIIYSGSISNMITQKGNLSQYEKSFKMTMEATSIQINVGETKLEAVHLYCSYCLSIMVMSSIIYWTMKYYFSLNEIKDELQRIPGQKKVKMKKIHINQKSLKKNIRFYLKKRLEINKSRILKEYSNHYNFLKIYISKKDEKSVEFFNCYFNSNESNKAKETSDESRINLLFLYIIQ